MAHGYPYTFTDMLRYLSELQSDPERKAHVQRKTLCKTIAGKSCDMLTVTSFQSDPAEISKRKGVVISSRTHPADSGASFMMEGVIDYLTGPTPQAKTLRDNFVFQIVPMVNIDGVINGSSRYNLLGFDLQNCWAEPSQEL